MQLVMYLLVNGFAIFIAAQVLAGVHVESFWTAIIVAVSLGIINTIIKPILLFLTLPITLLTLGLFTFVVNALLVLLVTKIVPGFHVDGFWWALLFSLVIAVISAFLNSLLNS